MDGILCLDKPAEMTSFAACAMLRRLTGEKKVGHAGTLDPMATGVLPLFFGKATRAIPLLPCHDKTYAATLQFGSVSDTLDIWGTMTKTGGALPSLAAIEATLPAFRGEILQVPPMTSALKKDGVRLYELARQGIEIPREARPVTIYHLEITQYDPQAGELQLICSCSAGTYIRTLCDDLGRMLGCGAVMTSLRRTAAAGYTLPNALTEAECRTLAQNGELVARILPVESAFTCYGVVTVSEAQAKRFQNGGALSLERLPDAVTETTRVLAPDGTFLGLGTPENGELQILRLF